MREAQVLQGAIDRVIRHREPKLLMQSHDQIARPPAHYAMDGRDRALVHDPGEESLVLVPELGGPARRGDVDEALWPAFVEPDHPVPQRLTVHSANCRRLCPRSFALLANRRTSLLE